MPTASKRFRRSSRSEARTIRFASKLKRELDLRTLADWVLRPRLLKISGVAQVMTLGGGRKQYQVLVDPVALHEYGLTLQDVETALAANNVNTTGGFSTAGGFEKPIRVIGRLGPRPEQVIADLKQIAVKIHRAPRRSLLEQVARIAEGPQIKRGDASINGEPGVALTVIKQPHTDTRALTAAVRDCLAGDRAVAAGRRGARNRLFQLRDFIDRGVSNVGEALVIGAVLVLIVLFLFLLNFRTTFISLTAIPLSLAVTALVFRLVGADHRRRTVDQHHDARRHRRGDGRTGGRRHRGRREHLPPPAREQPCSPTPKPALRVVYEASTEIRTSIVFGTAVVVLVFLPLFALSGIEGRLFTPLGIAYIVSILASLAGVADRHAGAVVLPARESRAVHREREGFLVRGAEVARRSSRALQHAARWRSCSSPPGCWSRTAAGA